MWNYSAADTAYITNMCRGQCTDDIMNKMMCVQHTRQRTCKRVWMCQHMCMCVCVCVCMCVCVCACACTCMRVHVHTLCVCALCVCLSVHVCECVNVCECTGVNKLWETNNSFSPICKLTSTVSVSFYPLLTWEIITMKINSRMCILSLVVKHHTITLFQLASHNTTHPNIIASQTAAITNACL